MTIKKPIIKDFFPGDPVIHLMSGEQFTVTKFASDTKRRYTEAVIEVSDSFGLILNIPPWQLRKVYKKR